MKNLTLILAILVIVFFIGSCRDNRSTVRDQDNRLNIITSNFPPFDFIREIAGDRVHLTMLLPPGSESHSFEPSPRDIIALQNSDVFIFVGGESEGWVERILQSINTGTLRIVSMLDMVEVLEEEIVEGMEGYDHDHDDHDHDDHDDHLDIVLDEHVWTSPKNAILITRVITELLSELDPFNAAYYQQNAAIYIEALQELDIAFMEVIARARRRTIVFGDRFPFRYFAHDYGLDYFAAFPGCSTETEPSAATVAFLINKIRAEHIPVVFHIELSNQRMADTISEETGAKKLLLHAVHNISRNDFNAGLSYLELMRRNVANLHEALY